MLEQQNHRKLTLKPLASTLYVFQDAATSRRKDKENHFKTVSSAELILKEIALLPLTQQNTRHSLILSNESTTQTP
jgi:hypothetical protein